MEPMRLQLGHISTKFLWNFLCTRIKIPNTAMVWNLMLYLMHRN